MPHHALDPHQPRAQRLFAAWRSGDPRAGQRLFLHLRDKLRLYFRRFDRARADDLIQETLVAFVRTRDHLQDERALLGYLYTVAARTLARQLRRDARYPTELDESQVPSQALLGTTPERAVEARRMLELVRAQPPELAEVLELYYLQGHRGPEIASVLHITADTVHGRIRRSLTRLRRTIEPRPAD